MQPVAPNFVIVTLGVRDLDRSIEFYRDLGWEQRGDRGQGIVWFRTTGSWLGLFDRAELAEDAGLQVEELPAFRGASYAVNLPSEHEVDEAFGTVAAAGAQVVRAPRRAPWGGYAGYFADPDGHLWELCFNPGFPLDTDGRIDIR